jgi:hypothetical protein
MKFLREWANSNGARAEKIFDVVNFSARNEVRRARVEVGRKLSQQVATGMMRELSDDGVAHELDVDRSDPQAEAVDGAGRVHEWRISRADVSERGAGSLLRRSAGAPSLDVAEGADHQATR